MDVTTGIINRIPPNNLFKITIQNLNSTNTDTIVVIVYDRDFTPPKEAYKLTVFIPPLQTVTIDIPIYCLRYADSTIIEQLQMKFTLVNFYSSIKYSQLYDPAACNSYFTLT